MVHILKQQTSKTVCCSSSCRDTSFKSILSHCLKMDMVLCFTLILMKLNGHERRPLLPLYTAPLALAEPAGCETQEPP